MIVGHQNARRYQKTSAIAGQAILAVPKGDAANRNGRARALGKIIDSCQVVAGDNPLQRIGGGLGIGVLLSSSR
jgi:hypothetical protein